MRRILAVMLLPVAAAIVATPAAPIDRADLDSLVAAERAFSRASVDRGMRAAFLENLGPDSTLFRPQPVPGADWTRGNPDPGFTLVWEPVVAEIARGGDLGFTSGPYRVHPEGLDEPAAGHGTYATVWVRQPGGQWKVRVDLGVPHPEVPLRAPAFRDAPSTELSDEAEPLGTELREARFREEIRSADVAFDTAWREDARTAWRRVLAEDARVLRTGEIPRDGSAAALEYLTGTRSATTTGPGYWEPMEIGVASSGDLGYTWGAYDGTRESGYYVRVWRREGDIWRIVVDVAVSAAVTE